MWPSKARQYKSIKAILAVILAVAIAWFFHGISFVSSAPEEIAGIAGPGAVVSSVPSHGAAESSPGAPLGSPDTGKETTSGSTLAGGQMAQIRWDADTGVPAFLTGPLTPPDAGGIVSDALAFFAANKDVFHMTDPAFELSVKRQQGDALGMTHLQMSQMYKGVPVFGAQMSVHFLPDGRIQTVNGNYVPGIGVSVEPDITVDAAAATALEDFQAAATPSSFEPPQLVVLTPGGTQSLLTWKVTLMNEDPPVRMVYFIDAHSGEVVSRYDALEAARNRLTYTAGNGTIIPGTLLISEGGSSGDSVAQTVHNNTGATYDYYKNTFGRDRFKNEGAKLASSGQ